MIQPADAATQPAAPREVVLCRYGEIFLKGANRGAFEKRLCDNMRRALGGEGARVERLHGRVLVWPQDGRTERALDRLARVFGLSSLSPARIVERAIDRIGDAAVAEARRAAGERGDRPSFKVEARRSDKRFQPASPEIARQVGARVHEELALPVDLHAPAITVGVEVGFEHAFVWARTVAAPGGLPVGSSGRADLLLSGGIDSPVAGYLAMKRGLHLAATYFHSFPFTGDRTKEKVAELARLLARWQGEVELRVVPFTELQKALAQAGGERQNRLAVVLYRRAMLRIAERLARARGALGLVTGDALGQVASQTLPNLGVIGEVAGLPLLRPLIAHDKLETIAVAKRIGTYEVSIAPYEDCCSLFTPPHPETQAKAEVVRAVEATIPNLDALEQACVDGVERIACRQA